MSDERGKVSVIENTETALYRHFDKHNDLLYVGISLSAIGRLSQHSDVSHWFHHISRVTIEWFPTRREALSAEREAIRKENPRHNKQHKSVQSSQPKAPLPQSEILNQLCTGGRRRRRLRKRDPIQLVPITLPDGHKVSVSEQRVIVSAFGWDYAKRFFGIEQ